VGDEGATAFTFVRDAVSPTLTIQAQVQSRNITVTCSGTDSESGLACYTICACGARGDWQPILRQDQSTSYQLTGQPKSTPSASPLPGLLMPLNREAR
jgi:hypothetical protein